MKEQGVWERDAFEPQRPRVVLGDAHSWPQGLGAVGPGAGGGGRDSEPRLWSPWGERWGRLSFPVPPGGARDPQWFPVCGMPLGI